MKSLLTIAIIGAFAATAPAFADCTPPAASVQIPDGSTATRDAMIAAQKEVRGYNESVKTYSDCLQKDEDAKVAAGADRAKIHAGYAKLNNAQVDKLQQVVDKFNAELHAYKAKNGT